MTPDTSSVRGGFTFIPHADYLHIKLTRPADRTASGLFLPETRATKATEGRVLAAGPGRLLPEVAADPRGMVPRAIVWVLEGDVCLFAEHSLRPFGEPDEGLVAEHELLATVGPDNRLYPENEWVLLDPDPAPRISLAGIALADQARLSPNSGIVREFGPGELRIRGPLAGLRWLCRNIWNLSFQEPIIGQRAYWSREAVVMHAGGQVLVRARDLVALETP